MNHSINLGALCERTGIYTLPIEATKQDIYECIGLIKRAHFCHFLRYVSSLEFHLGAYNNNDLPYYFSASWLRWQRWMSPVYSPCCYLYLFYHLLNVHRVFCAYERERQASSYDFCRSARASFGGLLLRYSVDVIG